MAIFLVAELASVPSKSHKMASASIGVLILDIHLTRIPGLFKQACYFNMERVMAANDLRAVA
jgi:hypothetical protein